MKSLRLIVVIFWASINLLYAQCNPFYNFKEGAKWEITNYNTKDKVVSRQANEIKSLKNLDNGWIAALNMQHFDKKDKLEFEKEIEMTCENGTIKLDMSRFFPAETMAAFKDMNMTIETDNLEVPKELVVGQELKEASIKMSGNIPFTMETRITNRKVLAKEKITTPAGTFDCFKISYSITTKTIMNIEFQGVDWIAQNVGVVKSENYNSKGGLESYSLLTKIE